MFKKAIADVSQIEVVGSMLYGVPVADKILTKENFAFLNPEEPKSIFNGNKEIGNFEDKNGNIAVYSELEANKFYTYALSSALLKKANDIIELRAGEEKPKFEKPDERITAVLDEWTEKNKDNNKYITKSFFLTPATRYYSGKQGNFISENAHLDKLKDEELLLIANLCNTSKGEISSSIKSNKEQSPWLGERTDFTSEGWRERERIKAEKMYEIGLIDNDKYMNKMKWVEEFDFHHGWNFDSKNKVETEIVTIDKMTENAITAIYEFNKYFCLNAINKDKLFLEKAE